MSKRTGVHCVVVDDHVMVLQLLCGALRTQPGIDVVATGTGLTDADRLASLRRIDLLIVDAVLGPDAGVDLMRVLRASHPELKCLLLTDTPDDPLPADVSDQIVAAVGKASPYETLLAAVETAVAPRGRKRTAIPSRGHLQAVLPARECEVFDSLGDGLSNKELAQHLGISVQTVETHRKAISKKLGCNGASLVRMATLSRHMAVDSVADAHGLNIDAG